MDKKEILEIAIQKAIDGGYKIIGSDHVGIIVDELFDPWEPTNVNDIIFDHDFAKALWEDRLAIAVHEDSVDIPMDLYNWEYQLQQMVISDDPIKYLGENI